MGQLLQAIDPFLFGLTYGYTSGYTDHMGYACYAGYARHAPRHALAPAHSNGMGAPSADAMRVIGPDGMSAGNKPLFLFQ
ncbi:MAG: hypothetical protein WBF88_08740 [Pusillimonas sp.]